ncbi:hypothetical protein A1O1_02428 [Capronia coronata CBS 617.96]|uniref:Methyltransferase domain-containing protein n=1 Tax=Capronia coronata CBS 617.96 TaxID=1182541 RepID=W9YWI0_9EURO|nr:uncharacterized protein A1O1_02428 [Capronia coronata CBS 617.96]EXJ94035.1 hypothetical protein A1O1_02428 [Capronia coronata CBS 617.96]
MDEKLDILNQLRVRRWAHPLLELFLSKFDLSQMQGIRGSLRRAYAEKYFFWVRPTVVEHSRRLAIGIDININNIRLAKFNASRTNLRNLAYAITNFTLVDELRDAIRQASQELIVSSVDSFDVIFKSSSLATVPANQHVTLLRDLRSLIKPGGKLVFDFWSPNVDIRTIEVNFAILPTVISHNLQFERTGTALRKYVGSRDIYLKARTAVRALAPEAGWEQSPSTTVHPNWQNGGYEGITAQVRVIADLLAAERSKPRPRLMEFENARMELFTQPHVTSELGLGLGLGA